MTKHQRPIQGFSLSDSASASLYAADLSLVKSAFAARSFRRSLVLLQPMVAEHPDKPELLDMVATCYWELGNTNRALEVMDVMLTLWPNNVALLSKRAARHLSIGQKPEAAQDFRAALALNPDNLQLLSALERIEGISPDSDTAKSIERLARRPGLPAPDYVTAQNTLGRIKTKSDPKAAMAHFLASKEATPGSYSPAAFDALVESHQSHMPAVDCTMDPAPNDNPVPVFVTSLPRSGSTLLESMAVGHSAIGTLGESMALTQAVPRLKQALQQQLNVAATDPWAWLNMLPEAALQQVLDRIALLYRENSIRAQPAPGPAAVQWMVDKMPGNVFDMALAGLALPEARFVFVRRHPLDVGLSLVSNAFHTGHGFSKQLNWIGHFIRANYAMVEDCSKKLGPRLRQQSYRALVLQPDVEMRAVLRHIGADWQASCLAPETRADAVRTASVVQVRAGINQDGLEKWRPFEAELAPLIDALGGWDWIDAWEAEDARLADLPPPN